MVALLRLPLVAMEALPPRVATEAPRVPMVDLLVDMVGPLDPLEDMAAPLGGMVVLLVVLLVATVAPRAPTVVLLVVMVPPPEEDTVLPPAAMDPVVEMMTVKPRPTVTTVSDISYPIPSWSYLDPYLPEQTPMIARRRRRNITRSTTTTMIDERPPIPAPSACN